ncbi:DUF4041 domain-containing protein [Psychrobacillus sp. MER TA 171]|uniref:DUF4041 domain-containing protein n=1 Tax=Psychrobacillus sp. MER TA 171 TaxID=2939577 RepID=UPI00203E7092|nr:DUF4041 domain-containing protein [Psychrobacillus sp. MER TA 171]MCM3359540.1 DUF4041 domain-containing protein [Psychrobacillus sp. MER TA 171]
MFVSKKKYKEALLKISSLEQIISGNEDILKIKADKLSKLTKEHDLLIDNHNDIKLELEGMIKSEINSRNSEIVSLSIKIKALEAEIQDKTNYLSQLGSDIRKLEEENFLVRDINSGLQSEHNKIMLEVEKMSKEKYEMATIIERQLLQDLTEKIELQKEEFAQGSLKLEELEKKLRNKDVVLQEYIKVKKSLILAREEKKLQEVAFYKNIFSFNTTEQYKTQLSLNNQHQKEMIKSKNAVHEGTTWTVNGSAREGRKMANLNIKSMIRSYNTECDNAISSLKHFNFESIENRLNKCFIDINKLNRTNELSINKEFHQLKLEELKLIHELKIFEQNEKEKLRALREEERERKKVEQEIKDKLLELSTREKEIERDLNRVNREFAQSKGENELLLNKIKELEDSLSLVHKKREEVNQRHLIGKSGYVYIISNIGTLGENVYKIGMTRRLEPLERIKELSGASVPFEYDVHAMILTDDAPRLENHLHTVFTSNRVNLINNRKEFFSVNLEEIKREVFSVIGKDVVFLDSPLATHYYQTLALKNALDITEKEDIIFLFN